MSKHLEFALNEIVKLERENAELRTDGQRWQNEHLRLLAENAELRKDKARLRETLVEIGEYRGEGGPATPWQDIVRDLGQMARAAIDAAMEGDNDL